MELGEADPDRLLIEVERGRLHDDLRADLHRRVRRGNIVLRPRRPRGFGSGDTHKFELQYEHTLVGPYPEAAELYRARSPINFVDRIATPMLVLQGADDEIVPPAQAELIVGALRKRGVPHAYLLFEGEGHGFRKAESIVAALEAELSFYAQILGFMPADGIPKLELEHLT